MRTKDTTFKKGDRVRLSKDMMKRLPDNGHTFRGTGKIIDFIDAGKLRRRPVVWFPHAGGQTSCSPEFLERVR